VSSVRLATVSLPAPVYPPPLSPNGWLSFLGLKPTDEEIAAMIKDANQSGTGNIGFNEFYSMMTDKMSQIDRPNDLRTAFECYDTNGKGYITQDQFRTIMAENHGFKFTDKEVRGRPLPALLAPWLPICYSPLSDMPCPRLLSLSFPSVSADTTPSLQIRDILKAGEMEGGHFNYEKFITSMGSF
jgi:Ca2+-binding EF-hand superfamily protein